MTKHILVVEDEEGIQELLRLNLSMAGFDVTVAGDVDAAWLHMTRRSVDAVLLDWNMPGRPGIWFIQRIRADATRQHVPIIMLTARDDEHDKLHAFESGVDDYVTKPFRPRELIARLQALLRRSATEVTRKLIAFEGLVLDHDGHRVLVHGSPLDMGPTEYRLLHFFVTHPSRVYSRRQLLDEVWGDDADIQERTVDAYVGRLRNLLEPSGHDRYIETVRSVGYRFVVSGHGVPQAASLTPARDPIPVVWNS